ncbi:uncharacterized protein TA17210 [Theileria annulata]|uniref:Uncharacterized protein n=1 Tax=Theileria annulata TaxID=5874 RepID=Q4UAQ5_THEAN|nr:uncharacterized protein TA17210 [Theileria annulata]CAI76096.1 hypothetical protein TA17210 [Theileria annulata]|eukprot:XP_952722.1 hypothetical protein TA17210 [Theileria annulata]
MTNLIIKIIFIAFNILILSTTHVTCVFNIDDQKFELIDLKNVNTNKYSIILSENDPNAVKIVPKNDNFVDMVLISDQVLWLKKGAERCSEILLTKVAEHHVLASLKLVYRKKYSVISFAIDHDTIFDTGNVSSFLILNDIYQAATQEAENKISEDKSVKGSYEESELYESFNIGWEFDKLYFLSTDEPGSKFSKVYEPVGGVKINKIFHFGNLVCEASKDEKSFVRIEVNSNDTSETMFLLVKAENDTTKYFRFNIDWVALSREKYYKFLGDFTKKFAPVDSADSTSKSDIKEVTSGVDQENCLHIVRDGLYPSNFEKYSLNLSNIKIIRLSPRDISTIPTTKKLKIWGYEIGLRKEFQVTEIFLTKISDKSIVVEISIRHEGVRDKNLCFIRTSGNGKFSVISEKDLFDMFLSDFIKNVKMEKLKHLSMLPNIKGKEITKLPKEILDIILPDHLSGTDIATQTEEFYTPTHKKGAKIQHTYAPKHEMHTQTEPIVEPTVQETIPKTKLTHKDDSKKLSTSGHTKAKQSVKEESPAHSKTDSVDKKKLRTTKKSEESSFLVNKDMIFFIISLLIC